MENYLPYIVSVVCALISGFTSYAVARRQSKEDIRKLEKTYELDLENEKETFNSIGTISDCCSNFICVHSNLDFCYFATPCYHWNYVIVYCI